MSNIEEFKANIKDYLHFSTEAGDKGTKIQDWQDYQRNVNATIQNLIKSCILWQPNMTLSADNVVRSPNMKPGTYARVTKAGTTAGAEPVWTAVGTAITDGTVTYVIYPQNLDFATDAEIASGTAKNKMVTPAQLKSVKDSVTGTSNTNFISRNNANTADIDKETVTRSTGIALPDSTTLDDIKAQYGNLLTLRNTLGALGSLGDLIAQLLFTSNNGQVLTRASSNGGAWGAWKRLLNTDDKTALVNQLNSMNTNLNNNINNVKSQAGVVAGNVSNANAWWVKLGGTIPLIIQGGHKQYQGWVGFPIAFPHACFYASSAAYSGDWDHYDNMRNLTGFTIYGDGSNKLWIAFGY